MFDHVGLKVRDLAASVRFYTEALAPLGLRLCSQDARTAGFGPAGAPALWLHAAHGARGAGVHLALSAPDRDAVDRFHKHALEAGGTDHGTPGLRGSYGPSYYAAFVLDPDGNNVEAVCLR